MVKLREKPVLPVVQKIVNTPRRLTPAQNPRKRKLRVTPMKPRVTPLKPRVTPVKPKTAETTTKMDILRKVFMRRKPHPRSPTGSAKQLLSIGKSPNCFSFKNEFLHTPCVVKPVLHAENAYEAVSKMIHLTHKDIQEQITRIRIGKKRKYPKLDGSYLDRHYDSLIRKQQAMCSENSTFEKNSSTINKVGPKNIIRQNPNGSIYIEFQGSQICEYPPTVNITMMSQEMIKLYLSPRSKPNFGSNTFYQTLADVTIKRIKERRMLRQEGQAMNFEAEQ